MSSHCRQLLLAWCLLLAPLVRAEVPTLSWQLLRTVPRPPNHFTQGLVYAGPQLFESTGHYGQSRLIAYDAITLQMQQQVFLSADVFAEGLTALDGKLYQSSWTSHRIFVYDLRLQALPPLSIPGESWGLTTDGRSLIMSDGSPTLQFLDPATAQVQRAVTVIDDAGLPQRYLNELEWLDGDILANVWHRDTVLRIDSQTGRVKSRYDFGALAAVLKPHMPVRDSEQVLNGLAWNSRTRTLLVTGKDWPVWFELQLTLH